jgi:hypothetical protein
LIPFADPKLRCQEFLLPSFRTMILIRHFYTFYHELLWRWRIACAGRRPAVFFARSLEAQQRLASCASTRD